MAPSAVGAVIGSDDGNVVDEQMAQYAFRTLYASKDVESALNRLLEIIGRSFGVGRGYIFESSADGLRCSNTFEWCGQGILPQKDKLQNLSYRDDLDDYLKTLTETESSIAQMCGTHLHTSTSARRAGAAGELLHAPVRYAG